MPDRKPAVSRLKRMLTGKQGKIPDVGRSNLDKADYSYEIKHVTISTLVLVMILIITSVVLLGVTTMPEYEQYFSGQTFIWILRVALVLVILSLVVYLIMRERTNVNYIKGLLDELLESNRGLKFLLESAQDLGSTLDITRILEGVLDRTSSLTGSDMGIIYLWDKGEDVLKAEMVKGFDEQKMSSRELPMGEGLVGEAAEARKLIATEDMKNIDESDNVFAGAASPGSQLIVPLAAREKFVGVMVTATAGPHKYSDKEKLLLDSFAEMASLAITNAELYRIARRSLDVLARQRESARPIMEAGERAGGEPSKERGTYEARMGSLRERIEKIYIRPLHGVVEKVSAMGTDEWSRSREDVIQILEAGSAALEELIDEFKREFS